MAYRSRFGRRPDEYASKSSHSTIIKDPEVAKFLERCHVPKDGAEVEIPAKELVDIKVVANNPIKHVIAIDGSYQEVSVKETFPSAQLAFFQFGALFFSIEDLEKLEHQAFIDPADISKLNNIERFKLTIPTKNIKVDKEANLINSVRRALHSYCLEHPDPKDNYLQTIKWLVFDEYAATPRNEYTLSSCPWCEMRNVVIRRAELNATCELACPNCKKAISITDIFRLHEAIDNELGAGGILGYLTVLMEQIVLVHLWRVILRTKPALFKEIFFIKDGPLAFFGQTANMHEPMRRLTNFLRDNHNLYLAGLEKSGAFVEHAYEVSSHLKPSQALLLNNRYIYTNIIPGDSDSKDPYARTTYYGAKVIFKADDDRMYVVSLPVRSADVILDPKKDDYANLDVVLSNVKKLKCDMYDNALFPVALVNKLVSLSNHPSAVILEKFARGTVS
jgi:hypothetical protein